MTPNDDDLELDALLGAGKVAPSETLMARVLAQGLDAMPAPGGGVHLPWWTRATQALGGWPAMGGLAAAACAGVWIGAAQPEYLPDAAITLLGTEDLFVDDDVSELGGLAVFGWDLEEG